MPVDHTLTESEDAVLVPSTSCIASAIMSGTQPEKRPEDASTAWLLKSGFTWSRPAWVRVL